METERRGIPEVPLQEDQGFLVASLLGMTERFYVASLLGMTEWFYVASLLGMTDSV